MKNVHKIGLSAALAAGLLGCQAHLPLTIQPQSQPATETAAAPSVSNGVLPQVNIAQSSAQITINIKWPERQIQAIPTSANSLRIRIYSGQEDLVNDVIGREQGPTIKRSYNLKKGVTYSVEVKVYRESSDAVKADTGNLLVPIASTQNAPTVTGLQDATQSLAVTLTPLYQPTVEADHIGGGTRSTLSISGGTFGTDKSQITLWYKYGSNDWDKTDLTAKILSVADGKITFEMPSANGSGDLLVYRDGILATGALRLTPMTGMDVSLAALKSKYEQVEQTWQTNYYVPTGCAFPMPATPYGWTNVRVDIPNATYSAQVIDADNGNAVVAGAWNAATRKFTLPANHHYRVKYVSGDYATNYYDVYGATLNFGADPVNPVLVAPYSLPKLSTRVNPDSVDLSGSHYLQKADYTQLPLERADFTWGFDIPGQVIVDTSSQSPVRFKTPNKSVPAGRVAVTGTLNMDTSKQINFNADVLRLQGYTLAYLDDWQYNPIDPTNQWVAVQGGSLTVPKNKQIQIRIMSYTLTNGSSPSTLTLSDSDRYNLPQIWEGTDENLFTVSTNGWNNNVYNAIVNTGGNSGTATVRVYHPDEPTVIGSVQLTLQ